MRNISDCWRNFLDTHMKKYDRMVKYVLTQFLTGLWLLVYIGGQSLVPVDSASVQRLAFGGFCAVFGYLLLLIDLMVIRYLERYSVHRSPALKSLLQYLNVVLAIALAVKTDDILYHFHLLDDPGYMTASLLGPIMVGLLFNHMIKRTFNTHENKTDPFHTGQASGCP